MSHTTTIKTQFKTKESIIAAANEMGLPAIQEGEFTLFDRTKVKGVAVKLPNWVYPVVIDTTTGTAHFDNYGGKWGAQAQLDKFTQTYAVHQATAMAKSKGYLVRRQQQDNGSVQLVVTGFR
jgi:hypothetical protein